jgi:endonuclease YncB( thermonuclease family)
MLGCLIKVTQLLTVALFLLPSWAVAETIIGKVVGVTDGDTLTLLVEQVPIKVRLAEIDTPEKNQPWGRHAKQALSDHVFDKTVQLHVVTRDRYGRTVGHVYLGDRNINREMVRMGHAWVYVKYSKDLTLLDDEKVARDAREGLWSLPEATWVPPWEWRAARRGKNTKKAIPADLGKPFSCGTKQYCREMTTCPEAQFYLKECGLTQLDGDGDGVPCEIICH